FMASVVASGNTGAAVTTIDQWAFVGIGLIISAVCLTIMRPRVRANEDGVEIRNFIGTRFYPWDVIYGLSFPKGERWARLELPEFEFVPMWAFQSADGARVVTAVEQFRTLEDKYMPED
ncbi:PH domain-containing protein, partial [Corynebacterium durum]